MSIEELHRPAAGDASSEGIFGRTWELELLISGGVVFALFQLPPLLERGFIRLEPDMAGWWREASFIGYIYLKGIVYTLIGAFLLHLSSRAYWIGLVGMEKVHPEGVRWENLKSGPITRRVQRELLPPIRAMIARVDLFCSSIFSFAFLVVLSCLISIVLTGIACAAAWGLSALLGRELVADVFWMVVFGFLFLLIAPAALDKLLGARLEPESRTARALGRILRVLYRLQFGSLYATLSLVLFSNPRRRSVATIFGLILAGSMLVLTASHVVRREVLWNNDAPASEREIQSFFYEDQWPDGGPSRLAPSIQSDVIDDPYLELFIPYMRNRHDRAFEAGCPNPRAKLDCAARLHRVAVDGKPVSGLTFHFYTHPKSGARGFLAYLPTAGLSRGPHLLRIEPLPARKKRWLQRKDPLPYYIRFWT